MRIEIILFAAIMPAALQAQFCETITDSTWMAGYESLLRTAENRTLDLFDDPAADVPVTFHVEVKAGNPAVQDQRIAQAMESTNRWFSGAGVRFVQCGPTNLFDDTASPKLNRRTVNVAVFRAKDGCGYASGSYVYINANCSRTFENILSHELGHVLGLPHSHGYTNSGTTDELVDGSNCGTAGDRFCDTPADPNLLGKVGSGCVYTGTARDANGMLYKPMTRNIMSYTNSACADTLTPMQLARARAVALAASYACCAVGEPVVRDTTVCRGDRAVLTAISSANTLLWYDVPEGGEPIGAGSFFETPRLENAAAWYVEAVDSCVSPRARVVVHINPPGGVRTDIAHILRDLDTAGSSNPYDFLTSGPHLLFKTAGGSLWITGGGSDETRELLSVGGGDGGGRSISNLLAFRDIVLFGMNDRAGGPSLWRADPGKGTAQETFRFGDREGFSNFWLTDAGDHVFFMLNDGNDRTELWRSDGTAEGTAPIASLPETNAFADFGFTYYGGFVYFRAADSLHGDELWRSDGTPEGTRLFADLYPGQKGSEASEFTISDGLLYFTAEDSAHGAELWSSDGTRAGTMRITDINPGPAGSRIGSLASIGGYLFFYADDGASGYEPYVSDGTPDGTRMIADIRSGAAGSFPSQFTGLGTSVYCVANDGKGSELWRLDPGGQKPAFPVRKIHPLTSSNISGLTAWNGSLYFSANDGAHGQELWRSDGTEQGTLMAADIDTSGQGGRPSNFTVFRNRLYFAAHDATFGNEPRYLAPIAPVICNGSAATISPGPHPGRIRWHDSAEGGNLLAEGDNLTTPALSRSRTFWADLTSGNCVSARTSFHVRVLAPDPMLSDTVIAEGSDLVLKAVAESGIIEWYETPVAAAPFHTGGELFLRGVRHDTTYYARTIEENCSSAMRAVHVSVKKPAEIEPSPSLADLVIYPNPAHGRITMKVPEGKIEQIVLYDALGRKISRVNNLSGGHSMDIDVSGLPGGLYFVFARTPSRTWTSPVLVVGEQ